MQTGGGGGTEIAPCPSSIPSAAGIEVENDLSVVVGVLLRIPAPVKSALLAAAIVGSQSLDPRSVWQTMNRQALDRPVQSQSACLADAI